METIGHNNSFIPCDICYKEITNKVTLECKHELCVMCFLKMTAWSKGQIIPFKCHMCRKQYEWKNNEEGTHIFSPEETLSIHIREDERMTLSFRALVGMEANKTFEVIIQEQHIIQFIVILGSQTDTETLKFLISEFIANNIPILIPQKMTLYKA